MVIAQKMQAAMHNQVRGVRLKRLFLSDRFGAHGFIGKDYITQFTVIAGEGKHVRGLVFPAKLVIEVLHESIIRKHYCQFAFVFALYGSAAP